MNNNTLTAVAGLQVGHFTDTRRPTGCTVVLTPQGAVAGVDVRGAAPGTRETDLLSPSNTVQAVHAIVLSGGSAYGLDAASGVMRWLEEHGHGLAVGPARVPIVPAAVIFDLWVDDFEHNPHTPRIRPDAQAGYQACGVANDAPVPQGNVGAGAGACVGKLFGLNRAMKGGIGNASVRVGPWVVGALALMFVIMGLNLSGLFEFRNFVPSAVASLQFANPAANSLWSGVFAVVIASPCTAPFMGASLGLAIGLPAWQALPIFGAMGLGMALPFMALTVSTKWVQFLPRPGAWMVTFRQFMAFPMYATVLWLVWVLGQQVGLEGVTGFLICLLSLALVLWALPQQGKVGWGLRVLALVVLALSVWYY